MRKEIHIALRKTHAADLPHIWAELFWEKRSVYCSDIPEDLDDTEKEEIMNKIQEVVGFKACWRETLKMSGWSDQVFDDWWGSTTEKKIDKFCSSNCDDSNQEIVKEIRTSFSLIFGLLVGHVVCDILSRLL